MNNVKKLVPYLTAIILFLIASLLYFHPVLSGDKMKQGDIVQFSGMSKEIVEYRNANNNEEPYWLGNAFSGMPAYQVSAYFPNDYIAHIDNLFFLLPRPANYVFLYFLSFFALLMSLKVDWKLAILGALSFGFSTYLIIIFGAGHNAKGHAIAYMPLVVAGFLYVFRKKYLLGFVVTSLAMALEIHTNHPQMTYYLGFCLLILTIVEAIEAYKNKKIKNFLGQCTVLLVAVILGVGVNASRLGSMKEYAKYSTRGPSELTFNPNGTPKKQESGLSREYITEYSYGKSETFNLFIPRYMGGGSGNRFGEDTEFFKELVKVTRGDVSYSRQIAQNTPLYWGDQTIVEAPAYIGAIIVFLFLLGIFIVEGKLKIWLVSSVVFSILLSWGKNLGFLTDLFIDYFPLYNKFRAVSSIQVIAELCAPLLGFLALKQLFNSDVNLDNKLKALKSATISFIGLVVFGFLVAYVFCDFNSLAEINNFKEYPNLLAALKLEREPLLLADSLRSTILVLISAGLLYYFLKGKIKSLPTLLVLGSLILFDLLSIDMKYVNSDNFTAPNNVNRPFKISEVDKAILEDKTYYRVANVAYEKIVSKDKKTSYVINAANLLNEARTSYFHNSIGGYHAAKMKRYQELFDYNYNKHIKNHEIFNMLNVKYFIDRNGYGSIGYQLNPFEANGSVWFVDDVHVVNTADDEMKSLLEIDTKETAVVRQRGESALDFDILEDSIASIKLVNHQPNHLVYESNTEKMQFAVFSEIYYKDGWNAYVDGKLKPYYQTNYVLRGMDIPAGKHKIEFKFEPKVINVGGKVAIVFYVLLFILPLLFWFFYDRKRKLKIKDKQ